MAAPYQEFSRENAMRVLYDWLTTGGTTDPATSAPRAGAAGAYVVVGEAVLAAPAATIDFQNIPATYRHLRLVFSGRLDTGGSSILPLLVRFNNDSGANYDSQSVRGSGATVTAAKNTALTSATCGNVVDAAGAAGYASGVDITFHDYAGTTFHKRFNALASGIYSTGASNAWGEMWGGGWRSAAAINRITLFATAVNLAAGTVATLYGMTGAS